MPRLKPAPVDDPARLTPDQRRVYDAMMQGPRGRVMGPFPYLLRSPELCDAIQRIGAFVRFDSKLSGRLGELTIIVTARYWDCHYEWSVHAPLARKEGVPDAVIDTIRAGKRPAADADAALIHDITHMLYDNHAIDEATYAKGIAKFGEEGMLELVVMIGYYALLAQVFAAFEVLPAAGAERLPAA